MPTSVVPYQNKNVFVTRTFNPPATETFFKDSESSRICEEMALSSAKMGDMDMFMGMKTLKGGDYQFHVNVDLSRNGTACGAANVQAFATRVTNALGLYTQPQDTVAYQGELPEDLQYEVPRVPAPSFFGDLARAIGGGIGLGFDGIAMLVGNVCAWVRDGIKSAAGR